MSLLADLLAKIKQPQSTREVPPNLQNIVYGSAGQSGKKKKIILLSLVFVASITAGLFLVNYVKPLLDSDSTISIPVSEPPAIVEEQQIEIENEKTAEPVITAEHKEIEVPIKAASKSADVISDPSPSKDVSAKVDPPDKATVQPLAPVKKKTQKEIIPKKVRSKSRNKKIKAAKRDALLYTARKHELNNNYADALNNYKKALDLDRKNIAIINNIAYMYLQLNLFEDAAAFSNKALEINRDHVPSLINLAIAQARSENYTDAYSHLDRAIKLEPASKSVILNFAILNERQGNDSVALEYYSRLSNLGNIEGLLGKARIYDKTGKTGEALVLYRQILSSSIPDDSVKTEIRQRIRILLAKTRETANRQEKSQSTDY
jgi:Tfp pilus assembly protein PilF